MLDFSNPDAVEFAKSIIKDNMLKEARAVGWMADFGEYTPMDVKYKNYAGSAYDYHNRYPYDWAKANQEAIKEAGKEDETVYFMRSGSTISPGVTSLYWMGDQMTTFDKYDGIQSALIGMLNGGVCGFTLGHSDIGGYTSINNADHLLYYRRDEQVMIRWMEMSAFSDVLFRTHPSNNPNFNV